MVPAIYAYLVMRGKVQPSGLFSNLNLTNNQGQSDPLMFLASSLFAISACMLAVRIFPLFMKVVAMVTQRTSHVGPYMAIQETSRQSNEHINIMLLVMISLVLGIFSASMAKTLDEWMHDSQYYQVGADLVIDEYVRPIASNPSESQDANQSSSTAMTTGQIQALVGMENTITIPGINAVTFVGNYQAMCNYASETHACVMLGIDRLTFPGAAFFREDFSDQSLGSLMNALAANPFGVIVPQSLLKNSGLKIGDQISISSPIGIIGIGFNANMKIVGTYNYFPTVYPDQNVTVIVNLGTIFGSQDAATGYSAWLNLHNKPDYANILTRVRDTASKSGLVVKVDGNAIQQIQDLLNQPEWVGLFGILSVGFLLTGGMACIGFVLDTFASLRKHYVQLGILQAIGLSTRQLMSYLVLERVILMVFALTCGTIIGFLTSILFVPILQVSAAPGTPVPPFQVMVGWAQSSWLILTFGIVLLAAIIATIGYLVRIRIFQAVKMGETV
jgi:putative ABC transport system permease protein